MNINGLNQEEIIKSREEHGDNRLTEQKGETFWKKLWGNFNDPMIKILCVALIVNAVIAIFGQCEWYEPLGIAVAILLATMVSTFSEYKNENAFRKLQEEASKIKCKAFRCGEICEISIDDLVVGDCVLLESGDKIPADGVLIKGGLSVDQSVLNGESQEAHKKVCPDFSEVSFEGDIDFLDESKLFRGSVVCNGNGVMRVAVVGDSSVYGKIAEELQKNDERLSPLKVKLTKLAKGISKFGYIGGIAIAVAYLFLVMVVENDFNAAAMAAYFSPDKWMTILADVIEAFMLAIIIIVMAVPEGLPLMIALVSALNMGKMLKDHVLVRKIAGIETAGSLNILFSDKTGTITKGKLEVVTIWDGGCSSYESLEATPLPLRQEFIKNCLNNCTAVISGEGENARAVGSNSTERALVNYVCKQPFNKEPIIASVPFNSANKYSAASLQSGVTLIKGAPERILPRCTSYLDKNGNKQPLTDYAHINDAINGLACRAMRVLMFAYCDSVITEDTIPDAEYVLVCFVGIRDEVRPESIDAIKQVRDAGIQLVMITGDRKETALAIAKDAGIISSDADLVFTSDELSSMTDEQIAQCLPNIRVVARALPTDKSRLVDIAKSMNLVVGMTGDGVNDSPALKKADVGFGMGGGTEVAKEASDIVILDDNFSTISKAVLYGRTIFNSIRKFIIFQLTINIAAVLISFVAPFFRVREPLTIIQILWVNLVMDTLAALAFGGEPSLARYMKEKPKTRDESIVNKSMWLQIIIDAAWCFGLGLVILKAGVFQKIFPVGENSVLSVSHTAFFTFFIMSAVFNAFNARTSSINIFDNIKRNKGFLLCLGCIVVVQIILTQFGGPVFQCTGLDIIQWLIVLGLALTIIPMDMLRKVITAVIIKNKTAKQINIPAE